MKLIAHKQKINKTHINIICIATLRNMLSAILEQNDIFVAVLVTGAHLDSNLYEIVKKNRHKIGYIIKEYPKTYDDFFKMTKSDYKLSFNDIAEFEHTHLKVSRFIHRFVLDTNEVDYRYLVSLKFWLGIFNEFKIDYIFSHGLEHGDPSGSIPYDIAKKKNIPIYELGVERSVFSYDAYSLKKITNDKDKFLPINKITNDKINIQRYIYNKTSQNKITRPFKYKYRFWKKYHIKLPIKNVFTSKDFHKQTDIFKHYHQKATMDLLKDYRYIKNLSTIYNKLAVNMDNKEKYIFYPLHFEPEASIMNRGKIRNQLFVIKMLSEHLPNGWKLYVKEHPAQYALDDEFISVILNNVEYFRSEQFYRQILRLKNTKLIKINVSSKELIDNAKAIATICGTVTIESIVAKKPLLIFSDNTTTTSKVNDVFNINGETDLINAINKISKGYKPHYDNFKHIVKKYLIEFKMADLCTNDIATYNKCSSIIKFLNKDYKK